MEALRRLSSSPAARQHTSASASSEAAPFAAEAITKGGLISGERLMWDANERRGATCPCRASPYPEPDP
eukprot:scaffold43647_cov53-Phaeocystis_antarctica.AAC.1